MDTAKSDAATAGLSASEQPEKEVETPAPEDEKTEEKKGPWASPMIEMNVFAPQNLEFEIAGRKLILKPITLKSVRGVVGEVMQVISVLSENEELLKSFDNPGRLLTPETLNVLSPVLDSFSAILAKLLNVEAEWLEENLALSYVGPLFLNFVRQNNIGQLIENFRQAASEMQEATE